MMTNSEESIGFGSIEPHGLGAGSDSHPQAGILAALKRLNLMSSMGSIQLSSVLLLTLTLTLPLSLLYT